MYTITDLIANISVQVSTKERLFGFFGETCTTYRESSRGFLYKPDLYGTETVWHTVAGFGDGRLRRFAEDPKIPYVCRDNQYDTP
jgi:hypothetical protein